jgi:hypothetical protein
MYGNGMYGNVMDGNVMYGNVMYCNVLYCNVCMYVYIYIHIYIYQYQPFVCHSGHLCWENVMGFYFNVVPLSYKLSYNLE